MQSGVLPGETLEDSRPVEASRHVASVSAALTILSCFRGDEDLSLAEIHRRTGITKSRVMRLAGTLEQHGRSEEHTSELQSRELISYAVFCLDRKSVV